MDTTALLYEMRTGMAVSDPKAHAVISGVTSYSMPPSPPRFRYLTKSYVEALGLPEVTAHNDEPPTATWVPENAAYPKSNYLFFIPGVIHDEHFYRRSDDGLSYDLPTAPAFIR